MQKLQHEITGLRKGLKAYEQAEADAKSYDLSQDKLEELASRCELRWDHPRIREHMPPTLSSETIAEVGLSEAEVTAVHEEMDRMNTRLVEAIRQAWLDLGGDPAMLGQVGPEPLMRELEGRAGKDEVRRVFQQLAAERAGLRTAPGDQVEQPVVERIMRTLTSAGDALQQAIASRIGDELAGDLRGLRKGWGSRYGNSPGCPEE